MLVLDLLIKEDMSFHLDLRTLVEREREWDRGVGLALPSIGRGGVAPLPPKPPHPQPAPTHPPSPHADATWYIHILFLIVNLDIGVHNALLLFCCLVWRRPRSRRWLDSNLQLPHSHNHTIHTHIKRWPYSCLLPYHWYYLSIRLSP
jgi:hypothetical protein